MARYSSWITIPKFHGEMFLLDHYAEVPWWDVTLGPLTDVTGRDVPLGPLCRSYWEGYPSCITMHKYWLKYQGEIWFLNHYTDVLMRDVHLGSYIGSKASYHSQNIIQSFQCELFLLDHNKDVPAWWISGLGSFANGHCPVVIKTGRLIWQCLWSESLLHEYLLIFLVWISSVNVSGLNICQCFWSGLLLSMSLFWTFVNVSSLSFCQYL